MSQVVDISLAENTFYGDDLCYRFLDDMLKSSAGIVYSQKWRTQWDAVAGQCSPSGIPSKVKEFLTGWIFAMVRKSHTAGLFVGAGYDTTTLKNECIAETPVADQEVVDNAWVTIELAIHPFADGTLVFKCTCPQGMETSCQIFRSISFTSPEIAKIVWKAIS